MHSMQLILDSGCDVGLCTLNLVLVPIVCHVDDQSEGHLLRRLIDQGKLPNNCVQVRAAGA